MLRIRLLPGLLLLASTTFMACEDSPNYPDTPSIEFKSIRAERDTPNNGGTPSNRIFVTIAYKDGDGDLGLPDALVNTPPYTGDNRFNYLIRMYREDPRTGQYVEYIPFFSLSGQFRPMLNEDERSQPIRGDLSYEIGRAGDLLITDPDFRPGTRYRFDIRIRDRALNESNTITTEPVTLQ